MLYKSDECVESLRVKLTLSSLIDHIYVSDTSCVKEHYVPYLLSSDRGKTFRETSSRQEEFYLIGLDIMSVLSNGLF